MAYDAIVTSLIGGPRHGEKLAIPRHQVGFPIVVVGLHPDEHLTAIADPAGTEMLRTRTGRYIPVRGTHGLAYEWQGWE